MLKNNFIAYSSFESCRMGFAAAKRFTVAMPSLSQKVCSRRRRCWRARDVLINDNIPSLCVSAAK